MARLRNPRFAPEFLERKLNPSPVVALPPVQISRLDDPEPAPDPHEPGNTPPVPPYIPVGPSVPGACAV